MRLDWQAPDGFIVHSFAGDDPLACKDYVRRRLGLDTWRPNRRAHEPKRAPSTPMALRSPQADNSITDATTVARSLWKRREPIERTVAETYLREARAYRDPIPATLGFLPARGEHGAAMIAAFGMAEEIEPAIIAIPNSAVRAVHLTRLLPDGSGRGDKIILGRGSLGSPIILNPPNDLLGLAITEGIEDGLSIFEATGLGVWVAGSASRMPALADSIPSFVECVSIFGHEDDAGRKFARDLLTRLDTRGINAVLKFLQPPPECTP
ncbi:MAG TPA: toprim domain-containing protein [Rhizomicrobium sp.]|nr:toprim domain-containing protein [Rhizomicrobium sp.]